MARKKKSSKEQDIVASSDTNSESSLNAEASGSSSKKSLEEVLLSLQTDNSTAPDMIEDDVVEASQIPSAEEASLEGEIFESEGLTAEFDAEAEESSVLEDNAQAVELDADNELAQFESVEIEEVEFVEYDRLMSIVESLLFSTDRPLTVDAIRAVFKGTNVKGKDIRSALTDFSIKLAAQDRGVSLEEIGGGFQLRTKMDNSEFMKRHVKGRAFKLSGPALEVLSIVAYKQPCIKSDVDEIRGVESGHLMRALMDRSLIRFAGKSELPGKPMFYETTRKFLEIFGLRSVEELPSLSQIDELIPDGIGEIEEEKKTLKDLTPELSLESSSTTYSDGETELLKISEQLSEINTSSDFFEKEKARQRRKRDEEKAQDIREAMMLGQDVEDKDQKWLKRFEQTLEQEKAAELAAIAEAAQAAALAASQPAADTPAEELSAGGAELSDEEILANVEFETAEEIFVGEEVQGLAGTDFSEDVTEEIESDISDKKESEL